VGTSFSLIGWAAGVLNQRTSASLTHTVTSIAACIPRGAKG
jgi:hypothetical protein